MYFGNAFFYKLGGKSLILNITTSQIIKTTSKINTARNNSNRLNHKNALNYDKSHIECSYLTWGALLGFHTLAKLKPEYCSKDIKF